MTVALFDEGVQFFNVPMFVENLTLSERVYRGMTPGQRETVDLALRRSFGEVFDCGIVILRKGETKDESLPKMTNRNQDPSKTNGVDRDFGTGGHLFKMRLTRREIDGVYACAAAFGLECAVRDLTSGEGGIVSFDLIPPKCVIPDFPSSEGGFPGVIEFSRIFNGRKRFVYLPGKEHIQGLDKVHPLIEKWIKDGHRETIAGESTAA